MSKGGWDFVERCHPGGVAPLVCGDLLGPAGWPNEEVTEGRVQERYLMGMKDPRRAPHLQFRSILEGIWISCFC